MAESEGKSDVRSAQSTLLYGGSRLPVEPENLPPPVPAHLRW
jgi:hypothetical protein